MISQQEKQKKMFLIFGVVVVLIIVVLYFGFFQNNNAPNTVIPDILSESTSGAIVSSIVGINLDFKFLESDDFVSLDINGDIPIYPQTSGRANPFISY